MDLLNSNKAFIISANVSRSLLLIEWTRMEWNRVTDVIEEKTNKDGCRFFKLPMCGRLAVHYH
jgi:hypothetical protein